MSAVGPFALAFVAGMLAFTSPCCLPLMPGYVSYVSGAAGNGRGSIAMRRRVVGTALLFVLGFAIVFTLLGAGASAAGTFLLRNRIVLTRLAGVFVVAMGLAAMGVLRLRFLYRERRLDPRAIRPGPAGAVPLGMAFALGWTPCIGPVLAGILTAAASVGSAVRGAMLLSTFSVGMGLPFVLLALGYARSLGAFEWLRRHGRGVEVAGGLVLVAIGALMVTGTWIRMFAPLVRLFAELRWPPI